MASLKELKNIVRSATTAMTSVPKPFKFLKTHYQLLIDHYNTKEDSQEKVIRKIFRQNTLIFCQFYQWSSARKEQEPVFTIYWKAPIRISLSGDMSTSATWPVIWAVSTKLECKTVNLKRTYWVLLTKSSLTLWQTTQNMMPSICCWSWTNLKISKVTSTIKTSLKCICISVLFVAIHLIKMN